MRELSGRFCRREHLLCRCGLLRTDDARADVCRTTWAGWAVVSGTAWGLAIWNSAYEALILFVLVIVLLFVLGDKEAPHSGAATAKSRRAGWVCFVLIIAIALLLELRIPSLSILHSSAI